MFDYNRFSEIMYKFNTGDPFPVSVYWSCPGEPLVQMDIPLYQWMDCDAVHQEVAKHFQSLISRFRRFGILNGSNFSLTKCPDNVDITGSGVRFHRNSSITINSIGLIRLKLVFRNKKEIVEVVTSNSEMQLSHSKLEKILRKEYGITKPEIRIYVGGSRLYPGYSIVAINKSDIVRVQVEATAYQAIPSINDSTLVDLENGY